MPRPLNTELGGTGRNDGISAAFAYFTQSGAGAVERTVSSKLGEWVSVKDFGATGTGGDDWAAITAAIVYVTSVGGGTVFFPQGRYGTTQSILVSDSATNSKGGVTLRGAAPAGQGAVNSAAISEIFAIGAGCTTVVHFGDTAETSVDGNHIGPGGGICDMAITGSTFTTAGIRVYNISVNIENCYVSNVVNAGSGFGIWMKKAWSSQLKNVFIQSNTTADLTLISACNSFLVDSCKFLSTSTCDGIQISSGGHNSITILNCDFEGKATGINIDTTSSTVENISIIGCNFESNASNGIAAGSTNSILGLTIIGGRYSGANNGISVNKVSGGLFTGLDLNNCNLTFNQSLVDSNVLLGPISLNGSAAISGVGFRQAYTNGGLYEDNAGTGALSTSVDMYFYDSYMLTPTGAATSATITFSESKAVRRMGEFQLTIGNENAGATVGGAITLAGLTFKTTAAIVIPTQSKRTSVRFKRDANGLWWETARATNAG